MAHPHLKPCSLYLPAHKSSPPPFILVFPSAAFVSIWKSGKQTCGTKHLQNSAIWRGTPTHLEVPCSHFSPNKSNSTQKNAWISQIKPKKRNKETLCKQQLVYNYTKHHEIHISPNESKNEKKKKTSSLKALRQRLYAHPAKLSTWRLPNFFGWGGRQSRICASVNFHSGYRRESLLKMKNCDPNHRRSEIKKEWSLNQSGDTSGFFLLANVAHGSWCIFSFSARWKIQLI